MLLISVSAYKQAGAEWKKGTASQSDKDASSLPSFPAAFDLTIRGTDTVCIDWTLQVLLSFKWEEQNSS